MTDTARRPGTASPSWRQTALIFGMQLTLAFAFWSYAPLVDFMRRDLQLGAAELALIPVLLESAGLAFAPLAGWWVGRATPKVVARTLVLSAVLGLAVAGSTGRFGTVLLGLCFLGVSFVAVGPMTNQMLVTSAAPHRLGTAYSLKQSAVTIGMLVSTVMLPLVADRAGWRAALLAAAALTAVLGGLSVWGLAGAPERARTRLADSGPVRDFGRNVALVLRSPAMRLMFAIGFVFQGVIFTFMTFFVPLVVDLDGLSVAAAIALLSALQVATIVTRPALGWLSDVRPASDRAYYLVALAAFVGLVMMVSGMELSPPVHVGLLVVGGAAAFAWIGIYFARLAEIRQGAGLGFATGVALVAIKLGGITIPVAMGLLIDKFSYRVAFFVGGAALISCSGLGWRALARQAGMSARSAPPGTVPS
ncbi:MFS transporter [Micromonospora sp. NPDC005113]